MRLLIGMKLISDRLIILAERSIGVRLVRVQSGLFEHDNRLVLSERSQTQVSKSAQSDVGMKEKYLGEIER